MTDKNDSIIELKAICAAMKLDPREARAKLRLAVKDTKQFPELAKVYGPRQPWQWVKDSPAHKEAQEALAAKLS